MLTQYTSHSEHVQLTARQSSYCSSADSMLTAQLMSVHTVYSSMQYCNTLQYTALLYTILLYTLNMLNMLVHTSHRIVTTLHISVRIVGSLKSSKAHSPSQNSVQIGISTREPLSRMYNDGIYCILHATVYC